MPTASTSTDASTEVTPAATASPSGVIMEQIQKLLAERDVYWVNWLSSKKRETAGKKPESADEPSLFLLLNFMFLNHRQHLLRVNLNMGCR